MFSAKTYAARRNMLRTKIGSGIILLPGNSLSPNNYPNNAYYFRQDSSFRYYFGLNTPSLAGLIDADTGEEALYGDDFTVEDIIWTGPQPTLRELGAEVGVTATFPMAELEKRLRKAVSLGRKIHYLPPYRGETKLQLSALLGIKPELLHDYKSVELMFAVAEMREKKSAEEVEAMERAFLIGYHMHTLAMHMCHPGVIEREIAGAIEGIAKSSGSGLSFPSIVSQHGETLHNLNADGVLEQGRLLLCDAGCETVDGYCSDHTRTYPVSGRFTQKQKEIYNVVLAAHDHVARIVKPHMMYTEIHNAAYMTLAEGLVALGLLKGTAADAVASGAMTMLMPHGLGHGLGMDVHDCEAMGERSFDFSTIADRAAKSGTCIYNASQKSHYLHGRTGLDCFADDTGLEVEALGGAPGVHSARYATDGHDFAANNRLLLKNLEGAENRRARFRTVISLILGGEEHLFEGVVEGRIIDREAGHEGFGYDPLFVPDGYTKTFAEMTTEEKNAVSHRARAVRKLAAYLHSTER